MLIKKFLHEFLSKGLYRSGFHTEASIMGGCKGARAPPIFVVGGPYYWKGP